MMRTIDKALAPYEVSEPFLGRHYVEDHAVENGLMAVDQLVIQNRDGFPGYTQGEITQVMNDEFWGGVEEWRVAALHTEG